jgi:hypothetical protein
MTNAIAYFSLELSASSILRAPSHQPGRTLAKFLAQSWLLGCTVAASSAKAIPQFGQHDTVTAHPSLNLTQMISSAVRQYGHSSVQTLKLASCTAKARKPYLPFAAPHPFSEFQSINFSGLLVFRSSSWHSREGGMIAASYATLSSQLRTSLMAAQRGPAITPSSL